MTPTSYLDAPPMREAKDEDPSDLGLAGYAKILCSAVFVSGHAEEFARAHARRVAGDLMHLPKRDLDRLTDEIDYDAKTVRASLGGHLTRKAAFYGDQGSIAHPADHDGIFFEPASVETSLPDKDTVPWPMGDLMPDGPLPPEVDAEKLRDAVELAFVEPSRVSAFVVLYKGRLVAERYAPWASADTLLENWSMGKSLTATLVGRLMNDGHFGLDDPAPVPEWQTDGDPRANIRISDLLRMSSGLQFTLHEVLEETPDGTKVVRDCYPDHYYVYSGAMDVFRYVTSRPPQYEPNTVGRYRNCDPLTLGYIVKRTVEARGESYLTYPQRALFDEIGIRRLVLETDPYGNFVSSGYELGTARDWARLGQLYLQDGVWQGKRLLPEGFVDFVRTPAPAWANEEGVESVSRYGGLWWLNTTGNWDAPADAYYAAGAGGQTTLVIPSRDVVIARLTDYEPGTLGTSKLRTAQAIRGVLDAIAAN
jgi:CubicO group peptidase (beta-lactamase class C family)